MPYEEFFVIDMSYVLNFFDMLYDLKFVFDMPYDRNEYMNTSCSNTPVPPHFLILRCSHHKEAHVKQSRHLSMATHAYYCCPYKSVSNNTLHV
jgi:hypothetical protein